MEAKQRDQSLLEAPQFLLKRREVWGRAALLFSGVVTSVHYVEIDSGGYTALHAHNQCATHIYVVSGLAIVSGQCGTDREVCGAIVEQGEKLKIAAGDFSRICAFAGDCRVILIHNGYYTAGDNHVLENGGMTKDKS